MKKIILLTVLLALVSCKDEQPEPVYKDITGDWKFDAYDLIAGNFKIYGNNGSYKVKGTFKIKGQPFESIETDVTQLSLDPIILNEIILKSSNNEYISLKLITIDFYDYKSIYAESGEAYSVLNQFQFSSTVRITRK